VIIKEDLLHDKDRNSLAKLRAGLHDAEAQWDNLGSKEEVDNIRGIILDKSTNDSKGRQS
jgi:hypothetical protein